MKGLDPQQQLAGYSAKKAGEAEEAYARSPRTQGIDEHMRDDIRLVIVKDVRTELHCPFSGCDLADYTHVVDVKWEMDPDEGDRKRLLLEVRCENGHGIVLVIKNHAGNSFIQWGVLFDKQIPFGMDW